MNFSASLDRDANRQVIPSGLPFTARKTRTYTGATGLGEIGETTLFTVTGAVLARLIAYATVDLVGAGTLEAGVAGSTPGLLAQIADATTLDAGESWVDATPVILEAVDFSSGFIIGNGQDIIETIGAANITAGALTYVCFYRPISADGRVVAT